MDELKLPSAHQVGATVDVDFQNSKHLSECQVAAVKFTDNGKVLYDIRIPVGFNEDSCVIEGVDSICVHLPKNN